MDLFEWIRKLIVLIILVLYPFYSFAAEDNILICSSCSSDQMTAMAQLVQPGDSRIKTHVVDPYSGAVKAFSISKLERDPSVTRVIPTTPSPDIVDAAIQTKQYLQDITFSAETTHKDIIDKVRSAYPKGLPNHISVRNVPAHVAPSGLAVNVGNSYHIAVSQYLAESMGISVVDTVIGSH